MGAIRPSSAVTRRAGWERGKEGKGIGGKGEQRGKRQREREQGIRLKGEENGKGKRYRGKGELERGERRVIRG